ncbi:hypothetical protein GCM10027614_59700 [Micromonospora vulcania]
MSTLSLTGVSRWYGNVVAVNDISMDLGPGVTGLLGPNGAGKTTLLHMMAGFLSPSRGTVTLDDEPTWRNPDVYRRLGLVSEREAVQGFLSAYEFVLASAKLHRLADPAAAPDGRSVWWSWSRHRTAGSARTPRACGSGPGWPPRWCTTRRCCCSTSRSTEWTHASGCT